ncbi:MAG: hypothetical protein QM749_15220 [Aquabacterium sp.]
MTQAEGVSSRGSVIGADGAPHLTDVSKGRLLSIVVASGAASSWKKKEAMSPSSIPL